MMKRYLIGGVALLGMLVVLSEPSLVRAAGKAEVDQGQKPLSVAKSFSETMKDLSGTSARVTLVLKNGKEYAGFVKEVGNGQVVLTKLSGRDFFDAMIASSEIAALEIQARK